jgi:hypothetical protein
MILKQHKDNETRIFKITNNGLKVIEKSIFGEMERFVPFESISNDFVKLKFNPVQWILVFSVIVVAIVSGLFLKIYGVEGEGRFYYYVLLFLLGGIPVILFYGKHETVLSCYDDRGIEFYKNSPTKVAFDTFISQLFEKRNQVLKAKYGVVTEFISCEHQLEKFNLLHSLDIITMEELEELKNQLNSLAQRGNGGFTFNPN